MSKSRDEITNSFDEIRLRLHSVRDDLKNRINENKAWYSSKHHDISELKKVETMLIVLDI